MKNRYDEDASGLMPSHLFGWAVGEEESAPDLAARLVTEASERQLDVISEQQPHVEAVKEAADFGTTAVEALEEVGFTADFEVLDEGVRVNFDDDDGVFDRRRRRIAEGLVGRLAEAAGGEVTGVRMLEYANGGHITVGLMSGVGFGGTSGYDMDFNPFEQRNVRLVNELDVNIDDNVVDRLEELTTMWDGDYQLYDEGVELTLNEMHPEQREELALWIEGHTQRVGVPGTTLEEVLHDVYRRIRRRRR